MQLLKEAAESGADLAAAIKPLQALVAKVNLAPKENATAIGYWGDTAARILTLRDAPAHAWADVALLLGGANPRVRHGAVSALRDLSTGTLRGLGSELDLSPVLPELKSIASGEEGYDRDVARSVLKEIPVATDRGGSGVSLRKCSISRSRETRSSSRQTVSAAAPNELHD